MKFLKNIPLAPYTTVKIGGPAEYFLEVTSYHQFKAVLEGLKKRHIKKITVLGNGSNVLISDQGISGYVIKNSASAIKLLPHHQIWAASGTQLAKLIEFSLKHRLVGLESFAYIPSTLGGAIQGNIHSPECLFSTITKSTEIFDNEYPIILSAVIQLKPGNTAVAYQKVQKIVNQKIKTQPMNSLGCIFKNPSRLPADMPLEPAGSIIDKRLKLKGLCIGDAQISPIHANFITNNNQASARDYYTLIKLIQSQAKSKLNLDLELEIKLLGQI